MKRLILILAFLALVGGVVWSVKKSGEDLHPTTSQEKKALSVYADNLPGARDLEFSPGGTLLVSLTGSGKVVALPSKKEILIKLNRPHGLAFYQGKLFVAEEDKVARYFWDEQNLTATLDKVLFFLPTGGNHFTRSLLFDKEGRLLVSIGSSCNVCVESNSWRAAIIVSDAEGKNPHVFARGLRNSVFMTINPATGEIWATDMGRDFLGDDLPPDEINIVGENQDYGWPDCYGDRVRDKSFPGKSIDFCANTRSPIFEIPAHSAPLGLTFDWDGNLLVAYHGSWNRSVPTGYKVVQLKVEGNKITGAEDFLTDLGRPVDLAIQGNDLFISDDKAGAVYRYSR